ncbi:MAG: putative baseplate assembly protein [Bacteroidota bacterium]
MKASCGCCGGTEATTPASVVNRPGLPALLYRVGTHASFLETMMARLSSKSLPHLAGLTTRELDDPAIALLDAWSTVGDVLTFYQERIVNEGFLRTATERRSVLELARLVGYRLRPGVASTVYLAYTLEKGAKATIPMGARVQSVPGPGELPQSFETSEDLDARGDWNLLGVRRMLPQAPTSADLAAGGPLYFTGISTNLKPNDPLLADFGETQGLYRAMTVTADAIADVTTVTVQPWISTTKTAAAKTLDVITQFNNLEQFKVSASSQITKRVIGHLDDLKARIDPAMSDTDLQALLDEETHAKLEEEEAAAAKSRSTRLTPWLSAMRSELATAAGGTASGPCGSIADSTAQATTSVTSVFTALTKPPSIPPRNSLQLGRSTTQAFAAKSDITPQLLTAIRPELAANLYSTWKNIPVTPQPVIAVYALRARASVFGHNAPLKPITTKDGAVTGTQEWTLRRDTGLAIDPFRIDVTITRNPPPPDQPGIVGATARAAINATAVTLITQVTIDGHTRSNTRPLVAGSFTLKIDTIPEPVKVTIAMPDSGGLTLTFDIAKPAIRVTLHPDLLKGTYVVTSAGSDIRGVTITPASNTTTTEGSLLSAVILGTARGVGLEPTEEPNVVSLDATYQGIVPCGWIVLERPDALQTSSGTTTSPLVISRVLRAGERSRSDYGITAKGTRVEMEKAWINPDADSSATIRGTAVFAQSEALPLAQVPIGKPVCGTRIELDGLYDGLQSGRWVIVSGERSDVAPDQPAGDDGSDIIVSGVPARELSMITAVEQSFNPDIPGDITHTTIVLSTTLAYCYNRDSIAIHGNVAKATHGETRNEVLGSGDGSRASQAFALKQPPLTYVAAATVSGIESTLRIRVNDILWHEAESVLDLAPASRGYTTTTDDDDIVTVTFGNGIQGLRLPTGAENIRATYRNGIGRGGNVKEDQVSMLATRPLGVKEVINPLRASGGADRESRDQARGNAPLAVMALDRLVSVRDYADFARTFAGIGKASAARLSDGRHQLVHLTIAGADDIPIDKTSDLYANLTEALLKYGDPHQAIRVEIRGLLLLVISARVRIHPDYQWESVEPKIRAALLDAFSFGRRELGQDVLLSEVISTIQGIEGVVYVDLDALDTVDEKSLTAALGSEKGLTPDLKTRVPVGLATDRVKGTGGSRTIPPAQLAILSPDVPDTLILTKI